MIHEEEMCLCCVQARVNREWLLGKFRLHTLTHPPVLDVQLFPFNLSFFLPLSTLPYQIHNIVASVFWKQLIPPRATTVACAFVVSLWVQKRENIFPYISFYSVEKHQKKALTCAGYRKYNRAEKLQTFLSAKGNREGPRGGEQKKRENIPMSLAASFLPLICKILWNFPLIHLVADLTDWSKLALSNYNLK